MTGLGLATAAGLNAYIPMLLMGLLSKFTGLISLPPGWAWLENGWVMAVVAVLLVMSWVKVKVAIKTLFSDNPGHGAHAK